MTVPCVSKANLPPIQEATIALMCRLGITVSQYASVCFTGVVFLSCACMGTQSEHVLLLLANSFTVVLVAWFGLNGTVVLYLHMHTQRHEAQTVTLMALSMRFRSGRLLSSRALLDMHAKVNLCACAYVRVRVRVQNCMFVCLCLCVCVCVSAHMPGFGLLFCSNSSRSLIHACGCTLASTWLKLGPSLILARRLLCPPAVASWYRSGSARRAVFPMRPWLLPLPR